MKFFKNYYNSLHVQFNRVFPSYENLQIYYKKIYDNVINKCNVILTNKYYKQCI